MTKFTTYEDYMATLPKHEQQAIQQETKKLIKAYKLSQLRQSCKVNQSQLAERMGVSQANISKIERGEGIQVNTMEKYISALGGELSITAKMPTGDIRIV